ncbi:MAG TPA: hypothetical protein VGY55_21425 [Pirellulales bacterium]|jgi:hypothetical protein|nr:hypothetical protein [Pirellulales bacterium]
MSVSARAAKGDNWWQILQEVLADQQKRGFVGTVMEVDRSDHGYEERALEIRKNTIHGNMGG